MTPPALPDDSNMTLIDWLEERRQNCLRIAKTKRGDDREGWLEDASYFCRAKQATLRLVEAYGDGHANVGIRTHIALRILRAWNHGTEGYHALVVLTVNDWFDKGMKGPVPWPDSPFFDEWAEKVGYAKVGNYVGFSFTANLAEPKR